MFSIHHQPINFNSDNIKKIQKKYNNKKIYYL